MALATGSIKIALELVDAHTTIEQLEREVHRLRDARDRRDIRIDELEAENALLAERAITATVERDRAERRVAELELALDVERIRHAPLRWDAHQVSFSVPVSPDAVDAIFWRWGDTR